MFPSRRTAAALAAAATSAVVLAGCSGGSGGDSGGSAEPAEPVSQEQFDEAMSTPTELLFWTWVPDIENQVALFEEAYPEIDVEVVNAGQGGDQYTALRTALRAGEGLPDVVQMEFQFIPSFLLGDDLLDLSPYQGITDLQDQYPEWVWEQVTRGEAVYAVPQDTGPLGMLYREDLFAQAGIEPPATWDEFAAAAQTYRQANPTSYLTNVAPNQPAHMVGLMWANGATPFGFDGEETVKIDLDSPEVTEVVEYWQGLVQQDVVAVDPDFTDQWYQGLSNGSYATWLAAAWGPVFLQGTAENTSGLWRAAGLPQWQAGEAATGNWGGSTNAVLAASENPVAAAELARWINVEEEPATKFATEQFLFPPLTSILEDPAFLDAAPEFYGGQQVNRVFAEAAEQVNTDFGWLPFMDFAYSSFEDVVGPAIAERGDMVAAVAEWEAQLVEYAEEQGFTVE